MKKTKLAITLLICSLLIGCSPNKQASLEVTDNFEKTTSTIVNEYVIDKSELLKIDCNWRNITNIEARNESVSSQYIENTLKLKQFCFNNSLDLTFAQPLEHKIASERSVDSSYAELFENISETDTIHYFTDEEGLNIDFKISVSDSYDDNFRSIGGIYTDIVYKASIENIDKDFNYETSKLNEFRKTLLGDNSSLNLEMLSDFIVGYFEGRYNRDMRFFNKINDDYCEDFRIQTNNNTNTSNIYYKLVYDPKL
ncbi:hypothetical protein [Clostridium sp.]|uniref:hypothetical protein n=1 Tax=Clostridium sp. TaxID=1506 RepID=UPI003F308D26